MEKELEKFDIEEIFNTEYPTSVREAVRYGYQYRKISEKIDGCLHFSLPELSAVFFWIASVVASGIAYDLIKDGCKRLYTYLKNKKEIDKETEEILNNEESLKEFTICIEEYYSHKMKITVAQEKYIKDEVMADASAEETGRIRKETGRIELTVEEHINVMKSAKVKADELIQRDKE